MTQIISNIISALYAATGVVGFIAYLPTIKDLLKKKPSANSSSYLLWTVWVWLSPEAK